MARAPDNELAMIDYQAGMKYKDIADKYGVSINTVKSWKTRYKWAKDSKKGAHTKIEKVCTQKQGNEAHVEAVAKEVESVMSNEGLTDKQRLFCIHYSRSFNATQSYKKAYGVSYDVANAEGYKLLVNPCVRDEVMKQKQERYSQAFLSEEDIFQKYMDIAYSDITDYLTFGQKDIEYTDKAGNNRTVKVSYVDLNESNEVDGSLITEVSQGKDGVKVKLADKMKALQWLSDHKEMATAEQRAKMAYIEAQTVKLTADDKEQSERVVIVNDIPRPGPS